MVCVTKTIKIGLDEYVRMKEKIEQLNATIGVQQERLDIVEQFTDLYNDLSDVEVQYNGEMDKDELTYKNDIDKAIKETYKRVYEELSRVLVNN